CTPRTSSPRHTTAVRSRRWLSSGRARRAGPGNRGRPVSHSSAVILENEIGGLFGHHQGWRIDVAGGDRGKNGSVDHTKSGHTVDPQAWIDYGARRLRAHRAGTGGVEYRARPAPEVLEDFGVGADSLSRQELGLD